MFTGFPFHQKSFSEEYERDWPNYTEKVQKKTLQKITLLKPH